MTSTTITSQAMKEGPWVLDELKPKSGIQTEIEEIMKMADKFAEYGLTLTDDIEFSKFQKILDDKEAILRKSNLLEEYVFLKYSECVTDPIASADKTKVRWWWW